MGSIKPIVMIGIAVLALAGLLCIIALATPDWSNSPGRTLGLFRYCVNGVCIDHIRIGTHMQTVRALMIVGFLGLAASGALALLVAFFQYTGRDMHNKIIAVLSFIGTIGSSVLTMSGIIFYADKFLIDGTELGYSFFLAIVSSIMAVVGGIIFLFGAIKA